MKISELQPKQSGINVEVVIVDKGDVREFTKFGKVGRVCTAVVKDDSGQINMTLWNDDIDKVKVGDRVKLTNGFVNEWQGEMQLTTGRAGQLEVLEGQAALSDEEPEEEKEEEPEEEKEEEPQEDIEEEPEEEPDEVAEEDLDIDEEFIE